MTWRLTASFHEAYFGDSDVAIEARLRKQFDGCGSRAEHHLPGIASAERILIQQVISLARSVRGMPGQGAVLNGGRVFQVYAQGAGGLIDDLGIISVLESAEPLQNEQAPRTSGPERAPMVVLEAIEPNDGYTPLTVAEADRLYTAHRTCIERGQFGALVGCVGEIITGRLRMSNPTTEPKRKGGLREGEMVCLERIDDAAPVASGEATPACACKRSYVHELTCPFYATDVRPGDAEPNAGKSQEEP